jgi:hypothetical protein
MVMPEDNGDDNVSIKITFSKPQIDFLDRIVDAGYALNRTDSVRYVIVQAMKNESEKI